jgi:hypothetical protein
MHLAVSSAIIETLESLALSYPRVDGARRKSLEQARTKLEKEL